MNKIILDDSKPFLQSWNDFAGYYYLDDDEPHDIHHILDETVKFKYPFKNFDDNSFIENGFEHKAELIAPNSFAPVRLEMHFAAVYDGLMSEDGAWELDDFEDEGPSPSATSAASTAIPATTANTMASSIGCSAGEGPARGTVLLNAALLNRLSQRGTGGATSSAPPP